MTEFVDIRLSSMPDLRKSPVCKALHVERWLQNDRDLTGGCRDAGSASHRSAVIRDVQGNLAGVHALPAEPHGTAPYGEASAAAKLRCIYAHWLPSCCCAVSLDGATQAAELGSKTLSG